MLQYNIKHVYDIPSAKFHMLIRNVSLVINNFPNLKANNDKNKQERLLSISFQLFWQPEGAGGGFNHF
jgi:hypothetical protein